MSSNFRSVSLSERLHRGNSKAATPLQRWVGRRFGMQRRRVAAAITADNGVSIGDRLVARSSHILGRLCADSVFSRALAACAVCQLSGCWELTAVPGRGAITLRLAIQAESTSHTSGRSQACPRMHEMHGACSTGIWISTYGLPPRLRAHLSCHDVLRPASPPLCPPTTTPRPFLVPVHRRALLALGTSR